MIIFTLKIVWGWGLMKKLRLFLICLLYLCSLGQLVHAIEVSDELESPLYFSVEGQKAYLKTGWDDQYSLRQFFIVSSAVTPNGFEAMVQLIQLAPNYFFNQSYALENVRNLYPIFKKSKNIGPNLRSGKHGDFDYVIFTSDGRECLNFVNETGDSSSDFGVSVGTQRLLGYYCVPSEASISDAGAGLFFEAIGTKSKGEAPPAEYTAKLKLYN